MHLKHFFFKEKDRYIYYVHCFLNNLWTREALTSPLFLSHYKAGLKQDSRPLSRSSHREVLLPLGCVVPAPSPGSCSQQRKGRSLAPPPGILPLNLESISGDPQQGNTGPQSHTRD